MVIAEKNTSTMEGMKNRARANERSKRRSTCLSILLLLCVSLLLFAASCWNRLAWFGQTPIGMAGWTTAGSTLVARHWYREGAGHLWFTMYWEPASVETPLEKREAYVSFPPGAIVPVYLLAKVTSQDPTPRLTMEYDLFVQWATGLTLSLSMFWFLQRRLPLASLLALAVVPMVLYYFLPSPYFEHEMGYFSDQAIMLPYALLVLLEILRLRRSIRPRWYKLLFTFLCVWGILTDWLFLLLVGTLYVVWLISLKNITPKFLFWNSVAFGLPSIFALSLFALQLFHLHAFGILWNRFLFRSGAAAAGMFGAKPAPTLPLEVNFWTHHMNAGYGVLGSWLVAGCIAVWVILIVCCIRLPKETLFFDTARVVTLFLMPCLVYYLIFRKHSSFIFHSFAALKFALPLAIIPLALLPGLLLVTLRKRGVNANVVHFLSTVPVVMALTWVMALAPHASDMFRQLQLQNFDDEDFIAAHTAYKDIVFSSDLEIHGKPPQRMLHTMKQVYRAQSLDEILRIVSTVAGHYKVALFAQNASAIKSDPFKQFMATSPEQYRLGTRWMGKMNEEQFKTFREHLAIAN